MFFGGNNGILGAPMEQQGVSELQGYERRMNPGQGRVLSSNPMSYGQPGFQLTPGTNPFNPGQPVPGGMTPPRMTPPVSGEPVNAPLPTGAGGMVVPAGATPPFNPGESGGYRPGVTPSVTGTEVPDTGDVATDIQIAAGQAPVVVPFKSEMSLGDRMTALGMVLSAAGTPDFARVAGTVQAGITQRTQGIDKYNQDLRALTREQREQVKRMDGLDQIKVTPAQYRMSADGTGIEFVGNQDPYFVDMEGGDVRKDKDGSEDSYEKLAVAKEITRLTNIVDDADLPSEVRNEAAVTLQALQAQMPQNSTDTGRQAILTKSIERSEAKLAEFSTGMNGVLAAKRATDEALDMIQNEEVDTGLLQGVLTNLGLGDEAQGELSAKAVFQLLNNLQITKLTPVSNYEMKVVSGLWASVMNGEKQNIGALKEALGNLQIKIDQGFQAYGRDLNNIRTHNNDGYYDSVLRNYEGALRDYGYEVEYGDEGQVSVMTAAEMRLARDLQNRGGE